MTGLPPEGDALRVNDAIAIPRAELEARASRSGGAGGQHVNTSNTRIELRWSIATSRAVDDATRAKLLQRLSTRTDGDGVLRIVASNRRSQLQNREAAEERLAEVVRGALVERKPRRKTKPSRAAKEKRLEEKRQHSERKRNRREDY